MLLSLNSVLKCEIDAIDADLGIVDDCYFDDLEWRIRYFVVDTGNWLSGRHVLLSPITVKRANWSARQLEVNLTKEQVENSPGVEAHMPVSRQKEQDLATYYGWPAYWGPHLNDNLPSPGEQRASNPQHTNDEGSNLRRMNEVAGYKIQATDGEIGHVEVFIVDEADWTIRYVVMDTRNWLPGKKVLIAPWMIRSVQWDKSTVHLELTREQVKGSPEYDPAAPVNREYETRLYDYYGRPVYWQ